jgi:hypothetical protein
MKERELLARVAFETVHNNGITEKLYNEIEAFLAEPAQKPKPVAWRDNITGNFSHQKTDHSTPLYTTPPDAAKRIAELESAIGVVNGEYDLLRDCHNELTDRIANGIRVYVDTTNTGCPIRVFIGSNNTNATLILDEED